MSALSVITTDAGRLAIIDASTQGLNVRITHVAVGTGSYTPTHDRIALQAETERVTISTSEVDAENYQLNMAALLESNLEYWIGEVGFFDENGVLVFVWSDPDTANRLGYKSRPARFLLGLSLTITDVPVTSITIVDEGQPLDILFGPVEKQIEVLIETTGTGYNRNISAQLTTAVPKLIPMATEKISGIARFATAEEVAAGVMDSVAISPLRLAGVIEAVEDFDGPYRAPRILSPVQGATGISLTATISGSPFNPLYTADPRLKRVLEIAEVINAVANWSPPAITEEADQNDFEVTLVADKQYRARIKDVGVDLRESDWSNVVGFSTAAAGIATPTNATPTAGASINDLTPTLTSSAFLVTGGGSDTHTASRWVVTRASTGAVAHDSGNVANLVSYTVPASKLLSGEQYSWKVQHVGQNLGSSGFSTSTTFTVNDEQTLTSQNDWLVSEEYFGVYNGVYTAVARVSSGDITSGAVVSPGMVLVCEHGEIVMYDMLIKSAIRINCPIYPVAITISADGRLFIGGQNSLGQLTIGEFSYINYEITPILIKSYPGKTYTSYGKSIRFGPMGDLYAGGSAGILRINPNTLDISESITVTSRLLFMPIQATSERVFFPTETGFGHWIPGQQPVMRNLTTLESPGGPFPMVATGLVVYSDFLLLQTESSWLYKLTHDGAKIGNSAVDLYDNSSDPYEYAGLANRLHPGTAPNIVAYSCNRYSYPMATGWNSDLAATQANTASSLLGQQLLVIPGIHDETRLGINARAPS